MAVHVYIIAAMNQKCLWHGKPCFWRCLGRQQQMLWKHCISLRVPLYLKIPLCTLLFNIDVLHCHVIRRKKSEQWSVYCSSWQCVKAVVCVCGRDGQSVSLCYFTKKQSIDLLMDFFLNHIQTSWCQRRAAELHLSVASFFPSLLLWCFFTNG